MSCTTYNGGQPVAYGAPPAYQEASAPIIYTTPGIDPSSSVSDNFSTSSSESSTLETIKLVAMIGLSSAAVAGGIALIVSVTTITGGALLIVAGLIGVIALMYLHMKKDSENPQTEDQPPPYREMTSFSSPSQGAQYLLKLRNSTTLEEIDHVYTLGENSEIDQYVITMTQNGEPQTPAYQAPSLTPIYYQSNKSWYQ